MISHNYLVKVLSLSTAPKILTSLLSLVCFPLMVREMGASNYGVVVYVVTIIAMLEAFVDLGVSAAAGKAVAFVRAAQPALVPITILKWGKLQLIVAGLGFFPLFFFSNWLVGEVNDKSINGVLISILVLASWLSISLSFTRATLTSILAFKLLAILDICESIIRSIGWLIVAFFFTSVEGLACAQLFTASIVGIIGLFLLIIAIQSHKKNHRINTLEIEKNNYSNYRLMFKQSLEFLWLRAVTRIFQAIPIMLFGKLGSPALVGIVASFSKISEILNYPFNVIGNALAVKSQEKVLEGYASITKMWNVVIRFLSISLILSVTIYFTSDLFAFILLPETAMEVGFFFEILSITIFANTLSALIAPMSDYIGALNSRNILMTFFVIVEILLIFIGNYFFQSSGALFGYAFAILLMNIGYIIIAINKFFTTKKYIFPSESRIFVFYFVLLFSSISIVKYYFNLRIYELSVWASSIVYPFIFCFIFFLLIVINKKLRKFYLSKMFFEI